MNDDVTTALLALRDDIDMMRRAAQRREIELQGSHDVSSTCAALAAQRAYRDAMELIDTLMENHNGDT
jgi:hypothetical protein